MPGPKHYLMFLFSTFSSYFFYENEHDIAN